MSDPNVTTIIGLEVHVQLSTASKLFCGCSTEFGAEPNTQTCPVCTGMPGVLPVLNEQAVDLSIRTGLALNCEIARLTKWDRKNYFYPDLPKGYQISQYDKPVCGEGCLEISDAKNTFEPVRVRIERAHLEEDAGKSIHGDSDVDGLSKIDLNRTGTPLLEIVTKPDLRCAAQAKAFLAELKLILGYIEVSDCNMQQGSLRVDANVNLHIESEGQTVATPIVEIKNLNSFRGVERALQYEAARQLTQWQETGQTIDDAPKQTRGWDDGLQETVPQREKEAAADYRYFPDPDLVGITLSDERIESIRSQVAELPLAMRSRLQEQYSIPAYDADVIVNQGRGVVVYFEDLASQVGKGKLAGNWVTQEVLRYLNESELSITQYPVPVNRLAELLNMIQAGEVTSSQAKDVLAKMLETGDDAKTSADALGIKGVSAEDTAAICRQLIEENPSVIEQYQGGNAKALGALIGKAKKLNPNVNPNSIREGIIELVNKAN